MQDCSISSVLALERPQFCTKPMLPSPCSSLYKYRWLSAKLQHLQCFISNVDMIVLHWAFGMYHVRSSARRLHFSCRDHFMYAPSQWETMLHCNIVSHWLGANRSLQLGFILDVSKIISGSESLTQQLKMLWCQRHYTIFNYMIEPYINKAVHHIVNR